MWLPLAIITPSLASQIYSDMAVLERRKFWQHITVSFNLLRISMFRDLRPSSLTRTQYEVDFRYVRNGKERHLDADEILQRLLTQLLGRGMIC